MGDINAHINCNETDFIINDSDNVLDSLFTKKLYSGQYASFEKHQNPNFLFKIVANASLSICLLFFLYCYFTLYIVWSLFQ
jgi:hypothetical protein